jgi:hypothetical protein
LQLVDDGGNVVPSTSPVTLTQAEVLTALGATSKASGVRTSTTGADVSSVTIPANQASVTVYLDGVTQNAATVAAVNTALNTIAPNLLSASVSGSTLTMTFDNPLVLASGKTSSDLATAMAVTVGGTSDVVTAASISGNTVTLTLTSAPAHAATVAVSYTTGVLNSGYSGAVATFTTGASSIPAVTNNN